MDTMLTYNTNSKTGPVCGGRAEIYPLNIMEIKLQIRMNQIAKVNVNTPDPEYLIQTHFWF